MIVDEQQKTTFIHESVSLNKFEILKLALLYGGNTFSHSKGNPNAQDDLGTTGLIKAVGFGRKKMVKVLMKAGADPNIKDNKGRTAFDYAEFYCRDDILKWMKEYQS